MTETKVLTIEHEFQLKDSEAMDELSARGLSVTSLAMLRQDVEKSALRNLLRVEYNALQTFQPFTWRELSDQFPVQFFSEAILVAWKKFIIFIGPHFPQINLPNRAVVLILAYDLNSKTLVEVKDVKGKDRADPFLMFKRMPLYFQVQETLYIAFPNATGSELQFLKLNLDRFEWSDIHATGSVPLIKDYADGCYFNDQFIISQNQEIYILDLETLRWDLKKASGSPPLNCTGSSITYKDQLVVFSKEGANLYFLDLRTFSWRQFSIGFPLADFDSRRHCHLFVREKEELFLIRQADFFQMNVFNLELKEWKKVDTIGRRPNDVKTEASMVLLNHTIYVLCGQQSQQNRLLSISIQGQQTQLPNFTKASWVQASFYDNYKDSKFLVQGRVVHVHRSIIRARNPYFEWLLIQGEKKILQTIQNTHSGIDLQSLQQEERRLEEIEKNFFRKNPQIQIEEKHHLEIEIKQDKPINKSGPIRELMNSYIIYLPSVQFEHFNSIVLFCYDLLDLDQLSTTPKELSKFCLVAYQFQAFELFNKISLVLVNKLTIQNSLKCLKFFLNIPESHSIRYRKRTVEYIIENLKEVTSYQKFLKVCQKAPHVIQEIMKSVITLQPCSKDETLTNDFWYRQHVRPSGMEID